MKFNKLVLKTCILAGALFACTSIAHAGQIVIKKKPPVVKVEVRPTKPDNKAVVWVPGHWEWTANRYVWTPGHWVIARKGHIWVSGYYKGHKNGWIWVPGRWKKK